MLPSLNATDAIAGRACVNARPPVVRNESLIPMPNPYPWRHSRARLRERAAAGGARRLRLRAVHVGEHGAAAEGGQVRVIRRRAHAHRARAAAEEVAQVVPAHQGSVEGAFTPVFFYGMSRFPVVALRVPDHEHLQSCLWVNLVGCSGKEHRQCGKCLGTHASAAWSWLCL